MENGGHSAFGLAAGAATVTAAVATYAALDLPTPTPGQQTLFALAVTGAALSPDADTDKSMLVKSGGPVTRTIAEVLQWGARTTYRHTHLQHDRAPQQGSKVGEHRGLLHTWPFAVAAGVGTATAVSTYKWGGAAILIFLLAAGIRSLAWSADNAVRVADGQLRTDGRRHRQWRVPRVFLSRFGALAISAALVTGITLLVGLQSYGPELGLAVMLGMLNHVAGDGLTRQGVPWKFPFKHWCDRCRQRVESERCPSPLRRIPPHQWRCCTCRAARSRPKCARWKRCHNWPSRLRFTAGHWPEPAYTWTFATAGLGMLVLSTSGLLPTLL